MKCFSPGGYVSDVGAGVFGSSVFRSGVVCSGVFGSGVVGAGVGTGLFGRRNKYA